jgi:putative membrane protein
VKCIFTIPVLFAFSLFCSALADKDQTKDNVGKDHPFLKEAASGGMLEVKLGEAAETRAANPDVKRFGRRMVDDHSKVNRELMALAEKKGVEIPKNMKSEHQQTYDRLSRLNGLDFDKAYMSQILKDHREDIAAFEKEAKHGYDGEVKMFASKTLPTLKEHLRMAQEIAGKVGATAE